MIVEGNDDKFSVASLMGFHVEWPDNKENAPVHIESGYGADEIISGKFLLTELKTPGLQTLGIMLDADVHPAQERYLKIKFQITSKFRNLPVRLPPTGLIVENDEHLRFGLWIMPDNSLTGDLELFLRELVPQDAAAIWTHAVQAFNAARGMGCPCKHVHISKGNLYTWLAWQEPPGQSPGMALTQKILDPRAKQAATFVQWFIDLYGLPPLQQASLVLT